MTVVLGSDVKHVRLTLDADGRDDEIHPMHDLLVNAPYVERAKTTHWNFSGEEIGIMHYVEGDQEAFSADIESIPDVHDYELTPADERNFYAYLMCETTEPARELFGTFTRGRLVVIPPMEYAPDSTVSLSLVGTPAEIQAAIDGVPDPVKVEVTEISGLETASESVEALLSDRQREAAVSALELGYYEIPREASHEDVATAIGCAPSTAAEHIRKAEAKLLRSVLGT